MGRLLLAVLLLALSAKGFAQVKVPVDYFVKLLNQGKYDVVYDSIQRFRNKTPYGKSPTLDYLEAKCLCMNGTCQNAYYIFTKIFDCYSLSEKDKEFLVGEIASCQTPAPQVAGLAPQRVVVIPAQSLNFSAGVHGKLGVVYNCNDHSQFIDLSGLPPEEVMTQRVFDRGQKKDAQKYWSSLLGSDYKVDTSANRWVIITRKDAAGDKIDKAALSIQKTADFYLSYYHLSVPEKLITVFMMPDISGLQKAANKVHHIALSPFSLGYSNPYDLCLMGISDIAHIGTINHELFHLMIKSDIGDLPAWLDEGLACLYATASWQGDTLAGGPTWRTFVLKEAVNFRSSDLLLPTVKMLTSYTWDDFNSTVDQNICRVAINYAISNHLMLYFQEKHLLQKIVDAYRFRPDVDLNKVGHYPNNTEILEQAVNEKIESIQTHFFAWLKSNYSIDAQSHIMTTYIETMATIVESCRNYYTAMVEKGRPSSVINTYMQKGRVLEQEYYSKWFHKRDADERNFYDAEEQLRRGVRIAFADTDGYREFKKLYDEAIDLQKEMGKEVFK